MGVSGIYAKTFELQLHSSYDLDSTILICYQLSILRDIWKREGERERRMKTDKYIRHIPCAL